VAESPSPSPRRLTGDEAFNEVKKQVARRNAEAQKEGLRLRAAREKEKWAQRRKWDRL
jgi:hypothetical protein